MLAFMAGIFRRTIECQSPTVFHSLVFCRDISMTPTLISVQGTNLKPCEIAIPGLKERGAIKCLLQEKNTESNTAFKVQGQLGGRMGKEIIGEPEIGLYTLLYLKWVTTKDLLYSTGNCSMLRGSLDGRGVWGRMVHVNVSLSSFAVHLKLSQHY